MLQLGDMPLGSTIHIYAATSVALHLPPVHPATDYVLSFLEVSAVCSRYLGRYFPGATKQL